MFNMFDMFDMFDFGSCFLLFYLLNINQKHLA